MRLQLSYRVWACFMAVAIVSLAALEMAQADVPHMIQYQGRLTDDGGNPLDTTVDLTFAVYNDSLGSVKLWGESHSAVAVVDGLFDVMLGQTTTIGKTVFDGSRRWLGISIDGGGVLQPMTPIVSSGYSIRSQYADTASYATNALRADTATVALNVTNNGWVDAGKEVYLSDINDSVGIGTENPRAPLEVRGPDGHGHAIIGESHGSGTAAGVLGTNDSDGFGLMGVSTNGRGVTGLSTNGFGGHFYGPKHYFSNRVGIGTENPGGTLHLKSDESGGSNYLIIESSHATNWGATGLLFQTPQNTWHFRMDDDSNNDIPDGAIGLRSIGHGEVMTWSENGRVGIGTTGPNYPLEVVSSGNTLRARCTGSGIGLYASSGTGFGVYSDGPENFLGGLTGFGTTSPTHRVTVNGELALQKNGVTKYHMNYYNAGFNICETSVADYRLYIKDGGNVGIGTSNPTKKLYVNGDVQVADTLYAGALQADLVKADNIDDESGVAGNISWGSTLLTSSWQTLKTVAINAPGPGYVLAIASAHLWADQDISGNSSAQIGITETQGSLTEADAYGYLIPNNADAGNYYSTAGIHEIYEVSEAGYHYYYLQARSFGDNDMHVNRRGLTLIYFPTAYGTFDSDQWKKANLGSGPDELPAVIYVGMSDTESEFSDNSHIRIPEEKLNAILSEMEELKTRVSQLEQK